MMNYFASWTGVGTESKEEEDTKKDTEIPQEEKIEEKDVGIDLGEFESSEECVADVVHEVEGNEVEELIDEDGEDKKKEDDHDEIQDLENRICFLDTSIQKCKRTVRCQVDEISKLRRQNRQSKKATLTLRKESKKQRQEIAKLRQSNMARAKNYENKVKELARVRRGLKDRTKLVNDLRRERESHAVTVEKLRVTRTEQVRATRERDEARDGNTNLRNALREQVWKAAEDRKTYESTIDAMRGRVERLAANMASMMETRNDDCDFVVKDCTNETVDEKVENEDEEKELPSHPPGLTIENEASEEEKEEELPSTNLDIMAFVDRLLVQTANEDRDSSEELSTEDLNPEENIADAAADELVLEEEDAEDVAFVDRLVKEANESTEKLAFQEDVVDNDADELVLEEEDAEDVAFVDRLVKEANESTNESTDELASDENVADIGPALNVDYLLQSCEGLTLNEKVTKLLGMEAMFLDALKTKRGERE